MPHPWANTIIAIFGDATVETKTMCFTRVGKIGRLPKCIRDMLGTRIEDGQPGKELVKWLNGLPDVQKVLKKQFGGRPVTEQNLSDWKQTGHPEWLRQEESRSLAGRLTERSDDLDEAAEGQQISDRFATVLAAELARLALTLLEKETDPEKRWQRLLEVNRELSQLRRDDHRALRTGIEHSRWNHELEQEENEEAERMKKANKERLIGMCFAPMHNRTTSEAFGGGEHGKRMAMMLHCIKFDIPLKDMLGDPPAADSAPGPVKPNPGDVAILLTPVTTTGGVLRCWYRRRGDGMG
jgi:hypothetical protein